MKRKKVFLIFIGLVLSFLVLIGCAGNRTGVQLVERNLGVRLPRRTTELFVRVHNDFPYINFYYVILHLDSEPVRLLGSVYFDFNYNSQLPLPSSAINAITQRHGFTSHQLAHDDLKPNFSNSFVWSRVSESRHGFVFESFVPRGFVLYFPEQKKLYYIAGWEL